MVSSE